MDRPPRTIEQRRQALKLKAERMQTIVDMRAAGKTWKECADACGLNHLQRAQQLHAEALAEGLTPTPEEA